jgi:hypothetical protein
VHIHPPQTILAEVQQGSYLNYVVETLRGTFEVREEELHSNSNSTLTSTAAPTLSSQHIISI